MLYRAIGLMSGSSLDGLDIVYAEFQEQAGKWSYEIIESDCYSYTDDWAAQLKNAIRLPAKEYLLLHSRYGHYLGQQVNRFINEHQLHYKVAVVASHGHTTFHIPAKQMTAQLGDGAAIAAATQLPVVTDLRALDVAFGGQGAPIVPIGEKMLLHGYDYFLNLGGIANISVNTGSSTNGYIAFDVCPANRVLNMLANDAGKQYDENGAMASSGKTDKNLLEKLNALDYYGNPYPKSLANDLGTDVVYPLIRQSALSVPDALRTCSDHIVFQIRNSVSELHRNRTQNASAKLLCTGGGAFNTFLVESLKEQLSKLGVELVVPDATLVNYKEALIMAYIGVLRWRQEYNVLSSVTGAARNSIGGALWTGQEA